MASIVRNWFGGGGTPQPTAVSKQPVTTMNNVHRNPVPVESKTSTTSKECMPAINPANSKLEIQATPQDKESTGIISRVSDAVCNFFDFKTKLRNYFYTQCKGKEASKPEEINKAMRTIGAEPLSLRTSKGLEMRGMHFTVEAFASKMQAAGAQNITLKRTDDNQAIPAIVLDQKNPNYNVLIKSLNDMGFIGNVWDIGESNGKTYLWTKENSAKMNDCFSRGEINLKKIAIDQTSVKPFSPASGHTVVLNGGVYSRFESRTTATEVAKLLALGMNVVVSEDKNPGIIDTESKENVMANRDAIYNRLQAMGLRNDQIIWKGTCFSAIPAVEAAAKYLGSHAVIDQGYVSAAEMVKKQLPTYLSPLSGLVKPAVEALDFNYEMEGFLPQVKGNVVIINNNNDDKVPEGQLKRMQDALRKNVAVCSINDRNIKHAEGWFKDSRCNRQFTAHLIRNGWTAGGIIG
jgi:hypothetical protein